MNKDNKIYGIQRYVNDILGYSNIIVPGCIDLPGYIFKNIFDKYDSEIWFRLGQLHGYKNREGGYGYIDLKYDNHKYSLIYIMGDTFSTTDFDKETSDMIYNYFTLIKRKENLDSLLD